MSYKHFTQADFDYVDEKKQKSKEPIYFIYPEYIEQLKKHKIPVTPDMQDKELTNFIRMVESQESIRKNIPTIVRLRHINRQGENKGKKVEYMFWFENWNGTDKNGHKIAPVRDLPKGIDKGVDFSRNTDSQGNDTFTPEDEYWVYTETFDPEKLDKILQETGTDADSVQYTVMGIRPWSGFSYDEFRNLDFAELEERGRTGKVQQPVLLRDTGGRETVALIPNKDDKQTKGRK